MKRSVFQAPDIACEGCATAIRKALGRVEGVSQVGVDVAAKTVLVTHDEALVSVESVQVRLEHAGFPATVSST